MTMTQNYVSIFTLSPYKFGTNVTPIRYLNVFSPYWYFTFEDPHGNPIEIAGNHKE